MVLPVNESAISNKPTRVQELGNQRSPIRQPRCTNQPISGHRSIKQHSRLNISALAVPPISAHQSANQHLPVSQSELAVQPTSVRRPKRRHGRFTVVFLSSISSALATVFPSSIIEATRQKEKKTPPTPMSERTILVGWDVDTTLYIALVFLSAWL